MTPDPATIKLLISLSFEEPQPGYRCQEIGSYEAFCKKIMCNLWRNAF